MGAQDEGREMPFEIGLSGDQKGQGQRRTTWTRRRIFTHAADGRVEDACVHNDDRTRRSRWPRGMCRHFYGEARSCIYTHLSEGHEQKGKLARLCRSMYGTQDAASIWGDTWSDVLKESSMKVGTACPAFFYSCDGDLNLKGLCHGDDFCVFARQNQLQTFGKVHVKRFEVKQTGDIGFSLSDAKELKIFNRTIKIDVLNDEMTLEADTRLVEGALESMKFTVEQASIRHVSGEMKSEQHRSRIPRLTSAESTW